MRAGKIVALVAGILIVLIALAFAVPGGVLLGIYGTQRDDSGFFNTSAQTLRSEGYGLVTPNIQLHLGPADWSWLPGGGATVRIKATSQGDAPLFVGIGPSSDVETYLSGVAGDIVTSFGWGWLDNKYEHVDGVAPSTTPGQQDFWQAKQEGTGTVTLEWGVQDGDWTAVIMNADITAPVVADVILGARVDIIFPIGLGMLIGGLILLGVGILLIVLGARRPPAPPYVQGQTPYAPVAPQPPAGSPPVS
jgi:hypothetical protein